MNQVIQPKKVLFVITKSNWGGAQRYVYDLASNLQRSAFEPVVICGGAPGTTQPGVLVEKLKHVNVRTLYLVELIRDFGFLDWNAFWSIVCAIRAEKPDILHVNSSKAGGLGALAGRVTGVPNIVFTVHGWPFKQEWHPIQRAWIYLASWLTAVFSHHVIVVSEKDMRIAKRMWFMGKKIKYIPNALKTFDEVFSKESAERRLSFGYSGNMAYTSKYRLVTIAELTKNKGLRYGIDMIEELENRFPGTYTYTIFGEGEDLADLQSQRQKLQNPQVVYFESFATNRPSINLSTEASRYLRAFDIFILPSIKEGMPYVLLEAAAAGLPIVATNVVQQEASNISNIDCSASPGDGHALANAVEKLVQNMPTKTPSTIGSFATMLEKTMALYNGTPPISSVLSSA